MKKISIDLFLTKLKFSRRLKILINFFIDEKNPKLKEKYMLFANDYIERATQIKKAHISPQE